jgi:uncharacterized protein
MTRRVCTRCKSRTAAGTQCTRSTCIYSNHCWQHTKKAFHLQIKQSRIRGAGKGLVTTKARKKNEKIADYTGTIRTQAEYDSYDSGYGLAIPGGLVLDADSTQDALGRYANSCRKANKDRGECRGNNARLAYDNRSRKASVKAQRNLRAGEEVFVSYGRGYWNG